MDDGETTRVGIDRHTHKRARDIKRRSARKNMNGLDYNAHSNGKQRKHKEKKRQATTHDGIDDDDDNEHESSSSSLSSALEKSTDMLLL